MTSLSKNACCQNELSRQCLFNFSEYCKYVNDEAFIEFVYQLEMHICSTKVASSATASKTSIKFPKKKNKNFLHLTVYLKEPCFISSNLIYCDKKWP